MTTDGHTTNHTGKDVRQILTFILDGEEYGIPILQVQEIRGQTEITPIPNTPPHVRGVMNLRGEVVPVLDLRARLGIPPVDATDVSIVLRLGDRALAMTVDAVSDVLDLMDEQIAPMPEVHGADKTLLTGMARCDGRLVLLLDVGALASTDGLQPVTP